MATKKFGLNRYINFTGNIELEDGMFDVSGVNKVRFSVEEAGGTNEIEIFVKIYGESDWDSLGTITGNDILVVSTDTYDELKVEVNTLDASSSAGFKILASGYQLVGSGGSDVELVAGVPTGNGSEGDVAIDTTTDTIYYWKPGTGWAAGAASSPSLNSTYVGFGSVGNLLTGSADFTFNDSTDTLSVANIDIDNLDLSGVSVDGIISDLNSAAADKLATSLSIKDYVDAQIGGKDEASEISYEGTASALVATNVQDAIDEVEDRLDTAETNITTNETNLSNHLSDTVDAHDASAISNVASGNLSATDVQSALDELQSDIDTINSADYVNSFNSRTGVVTSQASDYDADQIDYDSAISGLTADNVQSAIDEIEGRLDTAENDINVNETNISDHLTDTVDAHDASAISNVASGNLVATDVQSALDELQGDIDNINAADYVNTFNGRSGTVTAQASDYDADQIDYDGTASSLVANNVQDAIDEVEGRLDTAETNITTNSTDISDHINNTTDAHVASAITNTPSGNLTATDVQSALNELQTELDSVSANSSFADDQFRVQDNADNSKQIAFEASAIATSNIRTITMPDADVDLSDVNQSILQDGTRSMSADLDLNTNKITNLAQPTANNDAARKIDVDNAIAGVVQKDPVRVASTANIDLSTGTLLTIDGVSLSDGDRVLVKDQTDQTENGIYVASTGAWSRSTDFDSSPTSETKGGSYVFVNEGTVNEFTSFRLQGNGELTVDVDNFIFSVYSRAESIVGGDGIDRTGLTLDVNSSDIAGSGLEDDGSNNLRVSSSVAGNGLTGGSGSALSVQEDSTGGTNLASSVNSSANGVAIKIDDSTIGENGSNQLEVKDSGVSFSKLDPSFIVTDITVTSNDTTLPTTEAVDQLVAAVESTLNTHLTDDALLKHDADQIDYERADIDRKNIQADATSGTVEAALSDLDDAIGSLDATPTNYTPTDASIIADHLSAIDSQLAAAGGTEFGDDVFKINDDVDSSKQIAFEASGITTSTTRTITMPDSDVDLGNMAQFVDHDATTNFVANEHIDHSSVTITAGTGLTGGGDITASRTIDLEDTAVTPDTYGDNNSVAQVTVDQQGRITSASNVDIDHNLLTNFVSNEHIDHSTVDISALANGGLSGGGDITASRTLSIDITNATAETSNDDADLILIHDNSAGALRSMTRANFLSGFSTGNDSDISQTSFVGAESASGASVTGLSFANGTVRGFTAEVSVEIDATADLFEHFTIKGIQQSGGWTISTTSVGDDTDIIFNINSSGQVTYSSSTYAGFVSLTMKFRAETIEI